MARYRVKQGGCVMHQGRIYYGGSTEINNIGLTQAQLDKKVRSGYIEPIGSYDSELADAPVPLPPGADPLPTLPALEKAGVTTLSGDNPIPRRPSTTFPREVVGRPTVQVTPIKAPVQVSSIWTVDPATLEGMDIDQLNVLVKDRDANATAFTEVDAAKAQLSKDFKEAEAAK